MKWVYYANKLLAMQQSDPLRRLYATFCQRCSYITHVKPEKPEPPPHTMKKVQEGEEKNWKGEIQAHQPHATASLGGGGWGRLVARVQNCSTSRVEAATRGATYGSSDTHAASTSGAGGHQCLAAGASQGGPLLNYVHIFP